MLISTYFWSLLKILLWAELVFAAVFLSDGTREGNGWGIAGIALTSLVVGIVLICEVGWVLAEHRFRQESQIVLQNARNSGASWDCRQLPFAPNQPLTFPRWRAAPIPQGASAQSLAGELPRLLASAWCSRVGVTPAIGRVDVLETGNGRLGAILCSVPLSCGDVVYVVRSCRDGLGEYLLWSGSYVASSLWEWLAALFTISFRNAIWIGLMWLLGFLVPWPAYLVGIGIAACLLMVDLPLGCGWTVYRNGLTSTNNAVFLGPDAIEGGIRNARHRQYVHQIHSEFLAALQSATTQPQSRSVSNSSLKPKPTFVSSQPNRRAPSRIRPL
ncbi:MAG: hypothetical protein KDA84_21410 [Planctomycetaceae bacterium]|nr:hypothetical protein [Planctomycetaceae bacterium]